jgi:hypothetical protein
VVQFDKETEENADKIMMVQIWLYVIYNACLMMCVKKVLADKSQYWVIPLGLTFVGGWFYAVFGAFIPIMMTTFFNRSWCFMCIPKQT